MAWPRHQIPPGRWAERQSAEQLQQAAAEAARQAAGVGPSAPAPRVNPYLKDLSVPVAVVTKAERQAAVDVSKAQRATDSARDRLAGLEAQHGSLHGSMNERARQALLPGLVAAERAVADALVVENAAELRLAELRLASVTEAYAGLPAHAPALWEKRDELELVAAELEQERQDVSDALGFLGYYGGLGSTAGSVLRRTIAELTGDAKRAADRRGGPGGWIDPNSDALKATAGAEGG